MTERARQNGVAAAWSSFRKFCRALFGDDNYDNYVSHLRRNHPDAEIPDVRTFWREHYAEQDRNPGSRCC